MKATVSACLVLAVSAGAADIQDIREMYYQASADIEAGVLYTTVVNINSEAMPFPAVGVFGKTVTFYWTAEPWNTPAYVLVKAVAGEVVVIPPGFGHVTINPGKDDLVMVNLVSTAFSSDYIPYVTMGGAVCYEMADGTLVRNPRYPGAAPVRLAVPLPVPALCTAPGTPIYSLVGRGACLRFLNRPEEYLDAFNGCLGDLAERDVCAPRP